MNHKSLCLIGLFLTFASSGCLTRTTTNSQAVVIAAQSETRLERAGKVLRDPSSSARARLVAAGIEQTAYTILYDAAYEKIDYPMGDVPRERGVCTDVIIRAFRRNEIDLQKEVHEDIAANFKAYPQKWNASKPDSNIDHRRVPNLMTYFERQGKSLPVTERAADYLPGDVVTWDVQGRPHIGLVTDERASPAPTPLIVHNIGAGARIEDVLFAWKITGHYRFFTTDAPLAVKQSSSPASSPAGIKRAAGKLQN